MWLGTSQQLAKITVSDVPLLVVDSARNLGVIIDSQLCLDAQVAAVCRCGYYQLRQLRPVIRSLSAKATDTLVQAFVSSRLDYCNSLLYGVADGLYRRLQSVQNPEVRVKITGRPTNGSGAVCAKCCCTNARHRQTLCVKNHQRWMTLNGRYAVYCRKDAFFGAHLKN